MTTPAPQEVTRLLIAWGNGDQAALDELLPLVYQELHRLAARHLGRERGGHTLQTTALVHEAYLRLIDQKEVQWQNRAHFFAVAATLMRRILVDHARARQYQKRGGGARQVWVLREGQPVAVGVTAGISDGRMTEVESPELSPGVPVIIDQRVAGQG